MNLIKLKRILPTFTKQYRFLSTIVNEEYTEVPEYPPILKLDRISKNERKTTEWSQKIQALETVEEKQMKLNMPKYYGWKTIIINDQKSHYNSKNFIQHCTRTHFKEAEDLPSFYANINVDSAISEIKQAIEDIILFEYEGIKRSYEVNKINIDKINEESILTDSLTQQINRIILNYVSLPHLSNTQIDVSPRHEAFWFVGGIDPPTSVVKSRGGRSWLKDRATEPVDRAVQYLGVPSIAIRNSLPLEEIVSYSECDNPDFDVPFFKFDPKTLGFMTSNRNGTNIPGFWPGDHYEFGLLSYQKRINLLSRHYNYDEQDTVENLHSHGIMSSFAWLLSQANYQGFTTYNDVTYPFVTQTIVTNGKEWNFYVYQLNTIKMYSNYISTNSKRNICWGTKTLKLFDSIDSSGKIIGFNENVLKNLLKFYFNVPKEKIGVEMKPYLGETNKVIAEIPDPEKRDWLEKQYKHMMSNRPRHRLPFETYHWEKIYKIDNKTRVMEPRRRPFELLQNPWSRKYDERSPSYIPKALRPGGPKSKDKFYKNYYP